MSILSYFGFNRAPQSAPAVKSSARTAPAAMVSALTVRATAIPAAHTLMAIPESLPSAPQEYDGPMWGHCPVEPYPELSAECREYEDWWYEHNRMRKELTVRELRLAMHISTDRAARLKREYKARQAEQEAWCEKYGDAAAPTYHHQPTPEELAQLRCWCSFSEEEERAA